MQNTDDDKTTHFGYNQVPLHDKVNKVGEVFHSVANKYDLMNDLMSLGIHRVWKKITLDFAAVKPGQQILDLAGGTGDLAKVMTKQVGKQGQVVLADINSSMLEMGRERLTNAGILQNIRYVQANAECLPFADNSFHCITIAFGLRNVTQIQIALESMFRVLKPGGQLLILEFSKPVLPGLKPIYDQYSFKVLPALGKLIANDAESYQYLAESIRMHPDQNTLKQMLETAGFENCKYHNLTGGIVAVHRAYKF